MIPSSRPLQSIAFHPRFSTTRRLLSQTSSPSSPRLYVDFTDTKTAFKSKSFTELMRGILVFNLCRITPLVKNAEPLLKTSYQVLGGGITNKTMEYSFFGHFCAGEDENSIAPVVKKLDSHGVGSILDYAAESDLEDATASSSAASPTAVQKPISRVYDYKNEELCDHHMETFEKAIRAVKNTSPTGFAAIKCTALGNPELLKRVSQTLNELRRLFDRLDEKKIGRVSRDSFLATFQTKIEGQDGMSYFDRIDLDKDGQLDYVDWTNGLPLEELHLLTAHCTTHGPLYASVLNEEERKLLQRMKDRVDRLAGLAKSLGVRLMIDAEHTYFQPAIDHLTVELSRKYNRSGTYPAIFSTYQLYLKDSYSRLLMDMDRAHRGGYRFAAKLVRGAYMAVEREYANAHSLPDPIHPNAQETHRHYNMAIHEVTKRMARGDDIEIMLATHNQESVTYAVERMNELGLTPSSGIYFGQLLGMADHLTFCLADKGLKAYKYVPYGRVQEVMPYLIRRAQENSDALSGAKLALEMSYQEISRRLRVF
eukprot:gene4442-4867_t